jgi:hypothetical protein
MGKMRKAYKIFVGEIEVTRPVGRPGHRWKEKLELVLEK